MAELQDAALRRAWDAHAAELLGFAARALDDRGAGEEAVQETFVRAWRAADRFDPDKGSTRTWLFAICRRVVIDAARARAARPTVVGDRAPEPSSADDGLQRALLGGQLDSALRGLPESHRVVIVEVAVRGRPVREVAEALGVAPGTIHSRVFYGMRMLRVSLEEMGADHER